MRQSASRDDGDALFSARLKEARENCGLAQNAVAHRTKLADPDGKGISRTALIGYEQGSSRPGLREIRLLCEVLKVSPNWLIFGMESPATALQASMDFFPAVSKSEIVNVAHAALALTAVKGHERDAILSLLLSLAGRQLGDLRLSALLTLGPMFARGLLKELKEFSPGLTAETTLQDLAEALSRDGGTTLGNRLRFDEEFNVDGGSWLYPDPAPIESTEKSKEKS